MQKNKKITVILTLFIATFSFFQTNAMQNNKKENIVNDIIANDENNIKDKIGNDISDIENNEDYEEDFKNDDLNNIINNIDGNVEINNNNAFSESSKTYKENISYIENPLNNYNNKAKEILNKVSNFEKYANSISDEIKKITDKQEKIKTFKEFKKKYDELKQECNTHKNKYEEIDKIFKQYYEIFPSTKNFDDIIYNISKNVKIDIANDRANTTIEEKVKKYEDCINKIEDWLKFSNAFLENFLHKIKNFSKLLNDILAHDYSSYSFLKEIEPSIYSERRDITQVSEKRDIVDILEENYEELKNEYYDEICKQDCEKNFENNLNNSLHTFAFEIDLNSKEIEKLKKIISKNKKDIENVFKDIDEKLDSFYEVDNLKIKESLEDFNIKYKESLNNLTIFFDKSKSKLKKIEDNIDLKEKKKILNEICLERKNLNEKHHNLSIEYSKLYFQDSVLHIMHKKDRIPENIIKIIKDINEKTNNIYKIKYDIEKKINDFNSKISEKLKELAKKYHVESADISNNLKKFLSDVDNIDNVIKDNRDIYERMEIIKEIYKNLENQENEFENINKNYTTIFNENETYNYYFEIKNKYVGLKTIEKQKENIEKTINNIKDNLKMKMLNQITIFEENLKEHKNHIENLSNGIKQDFFENLMEYLNNFIIPNVNKFEKFLERFEKYYKKINPNYDDSYYQHKIDLLDSIKKIIEENKEPYTNNKKYIDEINNILKKLN